MNDTSASVDFKLVMPVIKSERQDGWYIRGIAAGVGPDLQNDELMPQAVQMLAQQINEGGISLKDFHNEASIAEDLGVITKATVTPDFQLEIEARLDPDNPGSEYLWKKVNSGKQFGFSIKGQSVGYYHDVSKGNNRRVIKHPYILLKHVGVTTRPVYTPSLGTVIRKAIDEADASHANEGETMTTSNNTGEVQDGQQQSSAPENDTATVEKSGKTPSQQLVADLLANDEFKTLIKSAITESSTESDAGEKPKEVEKSTSEDTTEVEAVSAKDVAEIVKSAITEVGSSFDAKLEALLDKIPERGPGLLVKSDEDKITEALAEMTPSQRLRLGLAAQRGELDKVR